MRLMCILNQQLCKHLSFRFNHINPHGKKAKLAPMDSEFVLSPLVLSPNIFVPLTDT